MIQPIEYSAIVGATIAVVEIIKRSFNGRINRFCPLLSVLVGATLGISLGMDWFASLTIGLAGSGLYDLGKSAIN